MSVVSKKNPGWLFLILVVSVALFAFIFLPRILGTPSIESLRLAAVNAATAEDQVQAAQQLAQLGAPALPALRVVAEQSQNPGVVAVTILAISRQRDYQSMNLILARLDDPASSVRSSAATALTKMLGRNYHFPVDGQLEKRNSIRNLIIKDWEAYEGSELYHLNKTRFED